MAGSLQMHAHLQFVLLRLVLVSCGAGCRRDATGGAVAADEVATAGGGTAGGGAAGGGGAAAEEEAGDGFS